MPQDRESESEKKEDSGGGYPIKRYGNQEFALAEGGGCEMTREVEKKQKQKWGVGGVPGKGSLFSKDRCVPFYLEGR